VLGTLAVMCKTSAQLRLENLTLRQQLAVRWRSAPRQLKLTPADRIFWIWLRRVWTDWKSRMVQKTQIRSMGSFCHVRNVGVTLLLSFEQTN
jgi:hypothetical protein